MRNSALVLGIVGGLWGMIVGFFGYGYTLVMQDYGPTLSAFGHQVDNVALVQGASFLAPILAIAGGAMARARPVLAGMLMLASAAGMYLAFGFGVFTMFPIGMCVLGAILAASARQPDAH